MLETLSYQHPKQILNAIAMQLQVEPMILSISLFPDTASLTQITKQLGSLKWVDGRATAGKTAREVKRNEQANLKNPMGEALRNQLQTAIAGNAIVKAAGRPRAFSRLMISKTADGGHYGAHVDNAMMNAAGTGMMRTDLSFTLFLSDPASYEGGDLVVHHSGMTQSIKGEAGEMVLYPSSSIHEVTPVTSGERIVCIGWMESQIADHAKRELLFDLENLRVTLRGSHSRLSPELMTLNKSIANLLRFWATP